MAGRIAGVVTCVLARFFCRLDSGLDGSKDPMDVEVDSNGIDICPDELDLSNRDGLLRVDVGHLASVHRTGMGIFNKLVLVR